MTRLNRQSAMRTACAAKKYGAHMRAHIVFLVFPFGAGAQRLLRFGGSKKSVFNLHSTGTASRRQKE
jgi:hypothetical protein